MLVNQVKKVKKNYEFIHTETERERQGKMFKTSESR